MIRSAIVAAEDEDVPEERMRIDGAAGRGLPAVTPSPVPAADLARGTS